MSWKLAAQENLLEGRDLAEKFANAQAAGFDGIELHGYGGEAFAARAAELRVARDAGVIMPSVCVMMDHFIGDFDADRRRSARAAMKELLHGVVDAGGTTAITPAAYGMFSRVLPPFVPPRPPEEDRRILLEELHALGEYATSVGAVLVLEPLNRYEDHMVNTLNQGMSLVEEIDNPSVRIMADTFHMNIEETVPSDSIRSAARWLGHVHLGDSNRFEPGTGHVDWTALTGALDDIGYQGWAAMECSLSGPPGDVLPQVAALLRPPRSR